jgi:hypothetical protein
LPKIVKPEETLWETLKCSKGKNYAPRITSPTKLFFQNEGEILSQIKKSERVCFVTTRLALQEILKKDMAPGNLNLPQER